MKSYQITKTQYNYLLPVFGLASGEQKLIYRTDKKIDKYYFIGTHEEYIDMLNRCKFI